MPRSSTFRTSIAVAATALLITGVLATPAAAAGPTTFSYAGGAVPIPDASDLSGSNPGAPVEAMVPVTGLTGVVSKVVLSIDGSSCSATAGSSTVGIDHTFVSDLRLTLISPNGTEVLLMANDGGSGNNLCQTEFDDDGTQSIDSASSSGAPFSGTWTPHSPLAAFDGVSGNGSWTLRAQDFYSGDIGNIRAFSLHVETAPATAVTGTLTAATTGNVGDTVTYTSTLTNAGPYDQPDNADNEYSLTLPAGLSVGSASSTTGTSTVDAPTRTTTWNGTIAAGSSTTITTVATIDASAAGHTLDAQGSISFDTDLDGTNESSATTNTASVLVNTPPPTAEPTAAPTATPVPVSTLPSAPVSPAATKFHVSTGATTRVAGQKTHVKATGLADHEHYRIRIGGTTVATGVASATGTVNRVVTIPRSLGAGSRAVAVAGTTPARSGFASLRVLASRTTLHLSYKPVGTVGANRSLALTVRGLGAGESVTLVYNGKRVSPSHATASGRGTYTLTVPAGWGWGLRTATATGAAAARAGSIRVLVGPRG